jgi:hypothetical protein
MINRLSRVASKPAFWGVVGFVILFVWGLRVALADPVSAVVGVAVGTSHGNDTVGQEVLVEFDEKWQAGFMHYGNDPRMEDTYVFTAVRRVSWREGKDFEPWASFGIAYWENAPAVYVSEELTYSLGLGLRWRDVIEVGWMHYSTAGRARQNAGFDSVAARAVMRF